MWNKNSTEGNAKQQNWTKHRTCDVWRILEWIFYETLFVNTNSHRESGREGSHIHKCSTQPDEYTLRSNMCNDWAYFTLQRHTIRPHTIFYFYFYISLHKILNNLVFIWCQKERIPNTKQWHVYLCICFVYIKSPVQTHIHTTAMAGFNGNFSSNTHRSSYWKVFRFFNKDHFRVCLVWYTSDRGHVYCCGNAKMNRSYALYAVQIANRITGILCEGIFLCLSKYCNRSKAGVKWNTNKREHQQ